MTLRIQDLPRFKDDCADYQRRIESIVKEDHKKQAVVMYDSFLNAVATIDRSVENLADSGPVFGNEHQLLRENLQTTRLDLVRWLKKHSPLENENPLPLNETENA